MTDTLDYPFTVADLATLRASVEVFGASHGLADLGLYRFVVAVHELVTNAIRHGGGHGHLFLHDLGASLRCQVTDQGPGIPLCWRQPVAPTLSTPNGRGLWLVHQIADTVEIFSGVNGASVVIIVSTEPGARL